MSYLSSGRSRPWWVHAWPEMLIALGVLVGLVFGAALALWWQL